jgi:hypothetical protein
MISGRRIRMAIAVAALCTASVVSTSAAEDGGLAGQRRFAVRDSVEMAEFTDVGWFSPDGRYYVTLTQRGVLPQGVSEATLWLFETSRMRTQVNAPSSSAVAAPVMLARMSAAVNGGGYDGGGYDGGSVIMRLEWAGDSRSLTFLGRDGQENRRLFRVNLYAPLRDQGKPVELQYMRSGQHNLTKPLQKLAHQEMIVDWFDFSLNDHEEPDAAKAEQYVRWRKLRDLRDAQAQAAPH